MTGSRLVLTLVLVLGLNVLVMAGGGFLVYRVNRRVLRGQGTRFLMVSLRRVQRLVWVGVVLLSLWAAGVSLRPHVPKDFHLTTVEVGATTATVALLGFATKIHFDIRDAWWKRVQWGLDQVLKDSLEANIAGSLWLTSILSRRTVSLKDVVLVVETLEQIMDPSGGPGD